jgi:hypothetical protein
VTSTGFDAGRAPEIPEMMDVLDKLGNPAALTLEQLRGKAPEQFLVCGWMTAVARRGGAARLHCLENIASEGNRGLKKLISLRGAFEDPALLGGMLGGESFAVMRTLLIAAMGEPLSADEMGIFTEVTGRVETPGEAVEELWIVAGRRSGKTIAIATLAAYLAGCCDHRDCLGPGERGVLPIMAANTLQAGQCYNFIRGIFTNIPLFAALVGQLAAGMAASRPTLSVSRTGSIFRSGRRVFALFVA